MEKNLAVVIPAYKASSTILSVIHSIGPEVRTIFLVDDNCPENSGKLVQEKSSDPRVRVIYNAKNKGVGGATLVGYRAALESGAEVIVKIDADGQMDTTRIKDLVQPILTGRADYAKGDRLDSLTGLSQMPSLRLIGNAGLTLLTKISTGYWNIKDPTNGFTAIHRDVLNKLPFAMLNKGYFFESDLLFRLSVFRAVVVDVPMPAVYGSEKSSLNIWKALVQFPFLHGRNFLKRISYNYFLRDINAASVELLAGTLLWWFGIIYGIITYFESSSTGTPATTGNVMIAVLPIILGFQLLLAFVSFDVSSVPKIPKSSKGLT
jgi:glycosyltransferase involved in cell wall biosynthesis